MQSYRSFFGPDVVAVAFGSADREEVTRLPPELLKPKGEGTVLGPISATTRQLALNFYAYMKAVDTKHKESIAAGDEAHRTFDAAYRNIGHNVRIGLEKLIIAQLACDVADENPDLLKQFGTISLGEGEMVIGYPKVERDDVFELVITGRRPFRDSAAGDGD